MNHSLHIQLSACEGAIIRALGLMERRGYRIVSCRVGEPGGASRAMEVSVSSSRPPELLKRQLERLHDVLEVELEPPPAVMPGAAIARPRTRRT